MDEKLYSLYEALPEIHNSIMGALTTILGEVKVNGKLYKSVIEITDKNKTKSRISELIDQFYADKDIDLLTDISIIILAMRHLHEDIDEVPLVKITQKPITETVREIAGTRNAKNTNWFGR